MATDTKAIVIVEDMPEVAELVQALINDVPGWGAVAVRDGALALEVITAVEPDLIILDVGLPGMSGFELVDLLRSRPRTAGIPVLVMSAAEHGAEAARRGLPFLAKPFDANELLARVERLLEQAPSSQPPSHDEAVPPQFSQ